MFSPSSRHRAQYAAPPPATPPERAVVFAALNVATGSLLQDCMPRHRHQEFLKFMCRMEWSVATDLAIHVILDNYATHKHPKVKRWLAVTSVDQLIAAITQYIHRRNEQPTPFVWTASVRKILAKVNKANETLATLL